MPDRNPTTIVYNCTYLLNVPMYLRPILADVIQNIVYRTVSGFINSLYSRPLGWRGGGLEGLEIYTEMGGAAFQIDTLLKIQHVPWRIFFALENFLRSTL